MWCPSALAVVLMSRVADSRPLVWFLCSILSTCTQLGYLFDHELLPTDCVPILEGWLRRGVVSSEATRKLTPKDTTPQQ